jgi:hypothetical protein
MTLPTLAPGPLPDPPENVGARALSVPYAEYDRMRRAMLAALAADAGGYPNPLGYVRDALDGALPRPGAHPREYLPAESEDAVWGRW